MCIQDSNEDQPLVTFAESSSGTKPAVTADSQESGLPQTTAMTLYTRSDCTNIAT